MREWRCGPTGTTCAARKTASKLRPTPAFFLNDPATTEIYTLPLPDALPISSDALANLRGALAGLTLLTDITGTDLDRKSTRLNSSHLGISYAVFCLKKK